MEKFDRGEQCMQRDLYEHFTLPGHSGFLHDVSIALIDKTDSSCPTKREDYWIGTLKTKTPVGLNVDFDDCFCADCLVFLHFCNWFGWICFRT